MSSEKSVSYIFGPMKLSMKYLAFNTLFGLFADQWNSRGRTGIMCRTLSKFYFSVSVMAVSYLQYLLVLIYAGDELSTFVYNAVTLVGTATQIFIRVFVESRMNQRLADYIQLLNRLEPILKPKRAFLRRNINCAYFAVKTFITLVYIYLAIVFIEDVEDHKFKLLNSKLLFYVFLVSLILTLQFPLYQPQTVFVSFQHVLKHCFEELALQIRRDSSGKNLNKYRVLHLRMFEACVELDRMLHPAIFVLYLLELVYLVAQLSLAFSRTSTDRSTSFLGGIFFLSSLLALACFSQMTMTSSLKLVHSAFASYDSTDKNVITEMEIFKLQLLCLKHTFSASKFFALKGDLILSILQSVISYTVIFYKVCRTSMP